jgi:hypothetical protein
MSCHFKIQFRNKEKGKLDQKNKKIEPNKKWLLNLNIKSFNNKLIKNTSYLLFIVDQFKT